MDRLIDMGSKSILISGTPLQYKDIHHLYQQTATTPEKVRGRVLSQGTSSHQLKWYVAGAIPLAVGDRQKSDVQLVSNKPDDTYQKNGGSIDFYYIQDGIIVELEMLRNKTINQNALVYAQTVTGLAIPAADAATGDYPVGRAMETVTSPAGAESWIKVALFKSEVPKPA